MTVDETTKLTKKLEPAPATDVAHEPRSTAGVLPNGLTKFIKAKDVEEALQCSRAVAYQHLRIAAGRTEGRGLLRVSLAVWEEYARRTFGS